MKTDPVGPMTPEHAEKCPECGYPQSRYHRDIAFDCLCTGDIVCEGRALKRAKVELSALRLELAALRHQVRLWETLSCQGPRPFRVFFGAGLVLNVPDGGNLGVELQELADSTGLLLIPAEPDAESREGRER